MSLKGIIGSCVAALAMSGLVLGAVSSEVADAVERRDKDTLRALIEQRADVNATQAGEVTALHWAVYHDDLESADLLIRAGANVNVANREGVTPLAMASLYGNAAMIDRLLQAGADAAGRGAYGQTTVMLAARNGNPEAIKLLAASGADVNASETLRGTTALMWAVEQQHPAAVKALVESGADVNARSGSAGVPTPYMAGSVTGLTPFDRAGGATIAQGGRIQAALEARDAARTAQQEEPETDAPIAGASGSGGGGLTPLTFAARQGDIESARILLESGADVNQVTDFGWSPLLVATENRNYQFARFLIGRGADVNAPNNHGWTPLYIATDNRNIEGGDYPVPEADMDHLEYIRLLLDHGANVNARVFTGPPRRHTTLTRTIFTMQWFFEEGATPFVRAAQSGDLPLMQLLLAHGANPLIPTSFEDTALSAAAGIGWVEGVTHEWSRQESLEAVKLLLELGLDPNTSNRDFRTPLMGAAHKGRPEVIQLLVDHGANLETRDYGSRDTHVVDLSGHGGWQALDYAEGLVRVGVQSALAHPEASALLRRLMIEAGLPVPPLDRTLGYICAVEGPLCQDPQK